MKKLKVSIVIVNYKVKEDLLKCIFSIYDSKAYHELEIIVVDNDEEPTIKEDLKKKFPNVRYIKSNGNIGYGAGNNLGAKYATGKYLLIVNPDTLFKNNIIDILANFLQKNKFAGAVSPLLLKEDGKAYDPQGSLELTPIRAIFSMSFISKVFPKNYISNRFWLSNKKNKKIKEVEVCPGTCLMIGKKLFEKIGGFDESFFLYFEEFDLCKRIKEAGYKMFILKDAKIIHYLGLSTDKNSESEKIFKKNRSFYFKKNYGLVKSLPTELFLRINKYGLLLSIILALGLFLRTYRLDELIPFIGDQGWFYISARDMLLGKDFPLVGITSSHTWLHQGVLWTYVLAILLKLFNFNPLAGFYFTAILGALTVFLVYRIGSVMFSPRIGVISSFLYATSPLIILHSRMSYHTSPIPFFTILFIYSVYKWIKGNVLYFPVSIFLLAVLYNLELATFSFSVTFIMVFIFGLFKKTKWARRVINVRTFLFSAVAFIIPMLPMIVYDLSHGFPQTLKFIVWIIYRIAVFFGYPSLHPNSPGETWATFFSFNSLLVQRLFYFANMPISFLILISSLLLFVAIVIKQIRSKRYNLSHLLIFLFFFVPFIGFLSQKTNSEAYLLIFFPTIMIILGIFFDYFLKHRLLLFPVCFAILLIGVSNSFFLIQRNYFIDLTFNDRIEVAKKIIKEANGRPYNILGNGEGSQFESFIMPHEYLAWWLGHGPSKKDEKLKFYVSEYIDRIEIEKK